MHITKLFINFVAVRELEQSSLAVVRGFAFNLFPGDFNKKYMNELLGLAIITAGFIISAILLSEVVGGKNG